MPVVCCCIDSWAAAVAGVEGGGVPPDLGTCLLQQKLAMVQLCIVRRRQAREQRAPVGVPPARHMLAPVYDPPAGLAMFDV